MPFQLPAMPNFNVQTPDILGAQQKMLELRALQGNIDMQPLQKQQLQGQVQAQGPAIEAQTLANQKAQIELDSQKAMQKAWSDPDFLKEFTGTPGADQSGYGFDPNAMTKSLVDRGVMPNDAMALTNQFIERSKNVAETQKTIAQGNEAAAGERAKAYKVLSDRIAGILDAPTSKAGDMLANLKNDLVNKSKAFAGVPQDDLAHLYGADLEHLPAMASMLGLDAQIADYHKSKADALKAQQGVIPDGGGLSPEANQKVQQDIQVATNPQIQKGKEQVAAAEGAARANVELQFARGNNAALANVPKELIAPATSAAEKANKEFADAKSVSDRMAATMAAAKNGNVVSYKIIPEEGTLQITTSQGVHRINKTEIDQYEGGGSLWQRMEGHFGKALTGKSIPDSVLKDMTEIQDIQARGAKSRYENSLASINQTYGSTFKPVEMKGLDAPVPQVPPAAAGMVNVQLKGGRTGTIKADQLKKFLADNPGSSQIK